MKARRGFTLVELVVAMTLALAVGGLLHRQLLLAHRLARAQAERIALQENARAVALVLRGELGVLGTDEIGPAASAALGVPATRRSDLLSIGPGAVTYLAARGGAIACGVVPGSPGEIRVPALSWWGLRAPRSSDSLLAFVESDPATGADDAWIHLGIASVSAATCPDGRAATALLVVPAPPLGPGALTGITPGAPVRLGEVAQMRYYPSAGKSWFGLRSVSGGEAITPVAGPLADSTAGTRGLTLRYLDATGGPTADPLLVRAVEITLAAITDQPVHGRDLHRPLIDTLALSVPVALRNGLRP